MVKPGIPRTARVAGAVSAVALLALASACSSSSGKSSTGSSTPSAPPAMSGTSGTMVNSASVSVNGTQTMVLTAPDGHTLYYFTPDTASGMPTCTGSCAAVWPALNSSGSTPTAASTVTGKLTVANNVVVYNGHPLYEYTGDSSAGQANGEGSGGTWFVATPTLAAGAGAPGSAPSNPGGSSTSGGGNY